VIGGAVLVQAAVAVLAMFARGGPGS
jgi:hypothetical protein